MASLGVGDIISGLLSVVGIGASLFGGGGVSTPKLQMPQVQTFQIPQADLQALNQQIQSNTQLSDSARQTALDAINSYNQGQLSAAYAGQYEQQVNQARQQVLQQLAAQGFTQGSQQYTEAMNNLQSWAANLKSTMLQQQLDAGLKTAGLSDQAAQDLINSWKTQSGITAQNNAANIDATNAYNQAQIGQYQAQLAAQNQQAQKWGNVANQVGNLAKIPGISSLLGGNSSGTNSATGGSTASTNDLISGSNLNLWG